MAGVGNPLKNDDRGAAGGLKPAATRLPSALRGPLAGTIAPAVPEAVRGALVRAGLCDPAHPAVVVELYGALRLKSGLERLPMHADTIAGAVGVLQRACPELRRLLPAGEALSEHYRFSINGRGVTGDLSFRLSEHDHLILFSASVGG
jgi:hypothetical protein